MMVADESVVPTLARVTRVERVEEGWEVEQDLEPRYTRHHHQVPHGTGLSCRGSWRNGMCVHALPDIADILTSGAVFVNKFKSVNGYYIYGFYIFFQK